MCCHKQHLDREHFNSDILKNTKSGKSGHFLVIKKDKNTSTFIFYATSNVGKHETRFASQNDAHN